MDQKSFTLSFCGEKYRGHYIKETHTAYGVIQSLLNKDVLFAIDIETEPQSAYLNYPQAGLSPHLAKIRLIQIFDGRNVVVLDMKHIVDTEFIIPFLEVKRFIAHNAVFELSFFKKTGVRTMNIGCTMLLAKLLIQATRPTDIRVGLQPLSEHILKTNILKEMQTSDWSMPELTFEQIEYAAFDAIACAHLAEKMAYGLTKFGMEKVYSLYKDTQHAVVALQLNGLGIDVEKHREHISVWRNDLYAAKKDLLALTGLDKITGHTLAGWLEKNLPPDILRAWPRTDTGKLQTDAHVFADFSDTPITEPFARFQKLEKLTSSFGANLIAQINPATKRIHASYKICGARTGRMSCSTPNLQQFPREPKYREIFVPSPGHVFVCADFNQIEIRVGAEISRDMTMLKAYKEGIDLHALTASKVSRLPIEQVLRDKSLRQKGKSFNFGLMFGLGALGYTHYANKMYGIKTSIDDARDDIQAWKDLYAGYANWQKEQAMRCEATLIARTPLGKVRKLKEDSYFGAGLNTPIQGGASEVMMSALTLLHTLTEHPSCAYRLVNCVHDEILVECPDDPEIINRCTIDTVNCMIRGYQNLFPSGVINELVSIGVGPDWGHAK